MNHEHYHIRWSQVSGSNLDWEVFPNREDAEGRAKELVRPGENYTIEQFNVDCPRCAVAARPANA